MLEKQLAQLPDRRLRPLPSALIIYSRPYSHGLLRAWNVMKIEVSVYFYTTITCIMQLYYIEHFQL